MDKLLHHHLKNGEWKLVKTTWRFYFLRNKNKAPQLQGQGMWSVRLVKGWYEPTYLWFQKRQPLAPEPIKSIVSKYILCERW